MDAQHARELLARERARVERELADPEQKPHDPEDVPDPFEASDGGAEMVEDELSEAEDEPLREDLAAIERAERRLEQGTYGISVESGEPIPDARLQAIPWAERTAEEQARLDR
jgi:DnaK suppressor protein